MRIVTAYPKPSRARGHAVKQDADVVAVSRLCSVPVNPDRSAVQGADRSVRQRSQLTSHKCAMQVS